MPPVALRKLLAYFGHHTHWSERVEHYLLHMLYYCVNMNIAPGGTPVSIEKLQAAMTRDARVERGTPTQDDDVALLRAEEIAGSYGKHQ